MLLKASIKGLNQEQKRQLKEFVHSDSEEIPDLGLGLEVNHTISSEEDEEEIKTKSIEELAQITAQDNKEDIDPLEDPIPTSQQILGLRRSEYIDSVCQDVELMEFFVKTSVKKLWKNVFWSTEDEFKIVDDIRQNYDDDKSLFRKNTRQTFLNEYDAVRNTKIPIGYNFPADPKLMQLCVAHKVKTDPSFLNLSGTGAGKTLSAILASRVINSKMTLIVCPNDVVSTWQKTIMPSFFCYAKKFQHLMHPSNNNIKLSTLRDQYLLLIPLSYFFPYQVLSSQLLYE
jgi:hypothetical protein